MPIGLIQKLNTQSYVGNSNHALQLMKMLMIAVWLAQVKYHVSYWRLVVLS